MNKRKFLQMATGLGAAACLPQASQAEDAIKGLAGLPVADAHAHPHGLFSNRPPDSSTPSTEALEQIGMKLCALSAVGDLNALRGRFGSHFNETFNQLGMVTRLNEKARVRVVRTAADLRTIMTTQGITGTIMAIEGADALDGQLQNLAAFHELGVRMVTLVHERDNELGFNQRSDADGPLTTFGQQVIERMNEIGMLVDVAHAKTKTLQDIVNASTRPVVDSHTSPVLPGEERQPSRRLRTWQEMEWIAKTGGVVCTWPFACAGAQSERTTLHHWAKEIVQMKSRLGIEHCGLGTDGGGGLPRLVRGWRSIADLPALVAAMRELGLSQEDIAAYVGGNFLRVLGKNLD